ncbi:MAG: hypothetical protein JJ900_13015 [Rhodospirillales bacterium]|nr:hypothetical protein [Rhodospirillales bacterium]MBO6787767.1 hypothetical protein [Rhodospirillales bacterium]
MAEPSDPAKASDKKPAKAASETKKTDTKSDAPAKAAADAKDAKSEAKPSTTAKSSSVPGAGSAKPSQSKAESENTGGGGGRAFLFLLVVVILLGGGGYVTRDIWLPEVEPYLAKLPGYGGAGSGSETATQPSPVELLTQRVVSLEKSLAGTGGADSVMTALKDERARVQAELDKALARIDDLETRLAEVRTLASAVTNSSGAEVDLAPILSRIDGLEQKDRETTGEVAALSDKVETIASKGGGAAGSGAVLAVAQLRDAALSGRPYAAQLSALKSVATGNTEITAAASRLESAAETGLPTVEKLQAAFSGIAGDIVAQARTGDGDWLDQAAGRLSALVSLRRTDGASGNPVEDAVAKIEQDLAARDIGSAAKTGAALADTINGEAKAMLEPWLLDAKVRATAERALDAMHAAALAALE